MPAKPAFEKRPNYLSLEKSDSQGPGRRSLTFRLVKPIGSPKIITGVDEKTETDQGKKEDDDERIMVEEMIRPGQG
jgi:hypothetical protein